MAERFRTRCKQGTLIVTDEYVRVELGEWKQSTLYLSTLSGVDSRKGALIQATSLTFRGSGTEVLQADLVKPNVAREIVSFVQTRIS